MNKLKDILDYIKNQNINFIGIAITPWHANGIDASYLYIKKNIKTQIRGLVLITPHETSGFVIDETVFVNKYIKIVRFNGDKVSCKGLEYNKWLFSYCFGNIIRNIKSVNSIYLVSSMMPPLGLSMYLYNNLPNVYLQVVNCDEGVGYYMGTVINRDKSIYNNLSIISHLYQVIRDEIIDFILKRYPPKIKLTLFITKKMSKKLMDNKIIYPYYQHVFSCLANRNNISVNLSNMILLCTTAWARDGIMDNEDLMVLKKVTKALTDRGHKIVLKTHPRDNFFKNYKDFLHCESIITDPMLSIETICTLSKPVAIISYSSTTLITSKLFWEIPTFCISRLLNRNKIPSTYLKEIDMFQMTFRDKTIFVNTVDELLENI